MAKKPRKGAPPTGNAGRLQTITPVDPKDGGHLLLSFRHLQPRFGVDDMNDTQRSEFLVKWAKRCQYTWKQLTQHPKHGLGWEEIPCGQFRPQQPDFLNVPKYMVFRHEGNHAFAGFKAGDTFYVLWIEARYNDLYSH
jgi:hypothetical protein